MRKSQTQLPSSPGIGVIALNTSLKHLPEESRKKCQRFVELLQSARRIANELKYASGRSRAKVRQQNRLIEAINEVLASQVGYRYLRGPYLEERFQATNPEQTPEALVEALTVDLTFLLDRAGELEKLKHCQECGEWMYPKKEWQKFCSNPCRQKFASHSQQFKDKRAEYMRKRRRDEKEKDLRSREAVMR